MSIKTGIHNPQLVRNEIKTAVEITGFITGQSTLKKICHSVAPSIIDASTREYGTDAKNCLNRKKGKAAPHAPVEDAKIMPK